MYFNSLSLKTFLISFLLTFYGFSQELTPAQIDSVVEKSMDTFKVPGMAVAVIKAGEVINKKGYGVQSVKTQKPVNHKTLFGVASNTKAFTTAAIAQLVDAGKVDWDSRVTDIIPEFKLYNPYVTREFTVRDLLTHRSGLGLGAGDLMVLPATNTTTLEEMIHNLRYLKPVSSFRAKFDYDNLLYIVAGEIITRVSGEDYTDYIQNHFFAPLHMKRATMDMQKIKKDPNRIDGHALVEGELKITPRTFTTVGKPAAGIYASIDAMTKWVKARLHYGKYGVQLQDSLFSKKQAEEMWSPQTIIKTGKGDYNTHFEAYGLAWFLKDVQGYYQASHTGGLFGIVSQVTLIPDLDLGIIVLTNQESGAAFTAITNSIKDGYFGVEGKDRIKEYNEKRLQAEKRADSIEKQVQADIAQQLKHKSGRSLKEDKIKGAYRDKWFGKVHIKQPSKGNLRFISEKSPELVGDIQFYRGTTYIVRWDNATFNADAFINFRLDHQGKAQGFTMEAISPLTDFSFDFQDLSFKRYREKKERRKK